MNTIRHYSAKKRGIEGGSEVPLPIQFWNTILMPEVPNIFDVIISSLP